MEKLFKIHWSCYVSAIICFYSSYSIYNDFLKTKEVYQKGKITNSIVVEKTTMCGKKRGYNWFSVIIVGEKNKYSFETSEDICDNTFIGDTLVVKYKEGIKNCILVNDLKSDYPKNGYYFSIFCILTGIYFLGYGYYLVIKKSKELVD